MRSKQEYDESHVITARRVKKVYWQSQNVGQAGYLTGGWGKMRDFILDPGGSTVVDTVDSRGRTTPVHPPGGSPTSLTYSLRCPHPL